MYDRDPDEMLSVWEILVFDEIDKQAPMKTSRVKNGTN